jgi:hypothetical protein
MRQHIKPLIEDGPMEHWLETAASHPKFHFEVMLGSEIIAKVALSVANSPSVQFSQVRGNNRGQELGNSGTR